MRNLMRSLLGAQILIALALMVAYAVVMLLTGALPPLWWLETPMALGVAVGYAWLGLLLAQTRGGLIVLVVRHMFRTLAVGMLLTLLPLVLLDRISPVTIGSFALIHWLGWWWVFGRKGAPGRTACIWGAAR